MIKPISKEEVIIWFNIHNMNYEKIELYGDVFKTLNYIINDTYMGIDSGETKINLSEEEKYQHFDWSWNKMVDNFKEENVSIKREGDHKDYFQTFYIESFYSPSEKGIKDSITDFLNSTFDTQKVFTKSDLEILTELYKLLDKNIH